MDLIHSPTCPRILKVRSHLFITTLAGRFNSGMCYGRHPLRQNFKPLQWFGLINLEVASIMCENARDIQTFRYSHDHRGLQNLLWHRNTDGEAPRSGSNLLDEEFRELIRSTQGSQ